MKTSTSRRNFLKLTGLGIAAGQMNIFAKPLLNNFPITDERKEDRFSLGIASYSLRKFSLSQTLEITNRLGLKRITLKDFHLPLNSSKEEMNSALKEISDAGIELYGGGVIYMKNEAEVNHAFEYANAAGMEMIVGVPEHELLQLVEQKTKEYNIKMAIHNHGPEDKRYPSPESIYEKIKNMDHGVGICLDIGHTTRLGIDPSVPLEKYFDRIIDVHIKDESSADADGKTLEVGRGIIDIPKFLKTLCRLDYKGTLAFEFEKDANDPLPGLAEAVGYVRGVLSVI